MVGALLVKKRVMLAGDVLSDARVSIGQFNAPYVSVTFDAKAAREFDRITGENVKKRMAIVLDNTIYSAPVIQERISGGRARITGTFSMEEANNLSIVLRAGALPAPLEIIQDLTVGPSLGQDSIEKGVKATLFAGLLVIVFMALYYRLSGVIANFALLLNLICLIGALAGLNATLTLSGIAGIILTIGMGVDSNVLIFERIRDSVGGVLSISYAKLGQQQKAEEAFAVYLKGWLSDIPPTIPLVMMFYNFIDPKVSEAVVESMVKAGLPPIPSDYYQVEMLERLSEDEIKKLLWDSTISGIGLYSGQQWWWEIDTNGGFKTKGGGFGNNDGLLWIEDGLLCSNIPQMTKGLKVKGAVFKNKKGLKEKNNEYLWTSTVWLLPFSVEMRASQSTN